MISCHILEFEMLMAQRTNAILFAVFPLFVGFRERSCLKKIHISRKKNIYLDFWTYIPGCSETHFGLLGKKWNPENDHGYEHKGVNLKNIYKDVLCEIAKLTKENFEEEGFEVKLLPNNNDKCYETYIIEISW